MALSLGQRDALILITTVIMILTIAIYTMGPV